MNPFFLKESKSKKHLDIKIDDVKKQKFSSLISQGFLSISVDDGEFNDIYLIRFSKTNLGIDGFCFLNNRPAYQGDFNGDCLLRDVINAIAGGNILD